MSRKRLENPRMSEPPREDESAGARLSPADGVDERSFKRSMRLFSRLNVLVYKLSGGRLMKTAMKGHPICIAGIVGRKTGKLREIPLIHVPHGEDKILVGSQAGLDSHPLWVHSLRANPDHTITFGGLKRHYRAREVEAAERSELWPHLVEVYAGYDKYQRRTERTIPVFRCTPRD
jgi:deazaflavin-dependent oxidoreductase (nitroreductase family)